MKLDWLRNYNLITFEEIDSTNSQALRMASSGASGDFIILSKIQTGGRGTKGRYWNSVAGNLYASILLESKFSPKKNSQLPFLIANAVYEAVKYFANKQNLQLNMKLKWPNDVLIDDKKLAGILIESISIKEKHYVIIGVGVNILYAPKVDRKTVSLKGIGIEINNPEDFLNILMSKFETLYQQWKLENNFARTRKDWMRRAYNLNKVITIDDGTRRISGIFKDIGLDGAMRLQLESGQYCNVVSGELVKNDA